MEYGRDHCAYHEVVPRPDCTATVAQLETCLNDTMAAQRAFYGALSCDMVNPDFSENVPVPPSCAPIDNSCDP